MYRTSLRFCAFETFLHGDVIVNFLVVFFMKLTTMATGMKGVTALMNLLFLICCQVCVMADKICMEALNGEGAH